MATISPDKAAELTRMAAVMGENFANHVFEKVAGAGSTPDAIQLTKEEFAVYIGAALRAFMERLALTGRLR